MISEGASAVEVVLGAVVFADVVAFMFSFS